MGIVKNKKMRLFLLLYVWIRSTESLDMTAVMGSLDVVTLTALGKEISMTEIMQVDSSLFNDFDDTKMKSVFKMDPKALKEFFGLDIEKQRAITTNLKDVSNSDIENIKMGEWEKWLKAPSKSKGKGKGGKPAKGGKGGKKGGKSKKDKKGKKDKGKKDKGKKGKNKAKGGKGKKDKSKKG